MSGAVYQWREKFSGPIAWAVVTACAFLLLPLILDESGISLVAEMLIWALAASSLNILLGDCGLVSFGHAGPFAVGAYTFGLCSYYNVLPFGLAILAAIVAVIIYSMVTGWFVVRLVEIYFALLCLAFSQIIWVICSVWYGITGGDDGVNGIPVPAVLFSVTNKYYFILLVVGISLGCLYIFRESAFGRCLHALRDNRTRASFIGINTKQQIFMAYVISGVFCGIAGVLLVILLHCAFPSYAGFVKSGDFLFVCLLGGMYYFTGPMVGAFLFVLINFVVSRYTEYWPIVMGTGVILIALFFRGGVTGFLVEKYQKHRSKKGA
jgi:branched-chain amino acid transport system permease protein